MPDDNTENQVNHVIGTTADDVITSENLDTDAGLTTFSSGDGTDATTGGDAEDGLLTDKINGNSGSDTIETGSGADLVAGDMVGDEWSFVDGKWVYDSSQIDTTSAPIVRDFDDLITTGDGDDVILGNGGDDTMYAGAGDDLINAGRGEDFSYGGDGADLLNLEDGDDYAEGGMGADVVNAGAGKDVVFGDVKGDNALTGASDGSKPTTMDGHGENGWNVTELDGQKSMTQTVDTSGSDTYSISFDLAANLSAGSTSGAVEVIWNGEVVGTIQTNTGAYQTHQIEVPSDADLGELSFREIPAEASGPVINTDGPVFSYTKEFEVGGVDVDVAAFAPGQAKLLQVIDGTLNVFDPITEEYLQVGDNTDLRVNAIGFNVEDDLIYGLALRDGVDHLGNAVSRSDLIMMDAEGNAYRVGETPVGDYVGDFDAEGNLWTFQSSVNSVTKIDVDNLDANGNPVTVTYDLPDDLLDGRTYDIAYSAKDDAFYAVESAGSTGGSGAVHKIDLSGLEDGEAPTITSIPITGTLIDGEMHAGMASGPNGAVFLDGDGNLYYGMNNGDHDMDATTANDGGIFQVSVDWDAGTAYTEFVADAQACGGNDGAVDPRAPDPFAPVDSDASFLIREPVLVPSSGGDDDLRGGDGDDLMYGGGGDDVLHGGNDDDVLHGDGGGDRIFGGSGDDTMLGGEGRDKLLGGTGDDDISGGADRDYIHGGSGDDIVDGGAGADKLVGGAGSDTIIGGAGTDQMWGGDWGADGAADTFVVSAGGGKDLIHDFEVGTDILDLSSYGIEFSDLAAAMTDKGWATEIDLSALTGGEVGDKVILKSVETDDLDESNFLL